MYCPKCGAEVGAEDRFCRSCGKTLVTENNEGASKRGRKPTAKKMIQEGERITENIVLCSDGKYRWIYEIKLLKNPTFFVLVWKIFFFILLGIFAFGMLLAVIEGNMNTERFLNDLKIMGIAFLCMTALVGLGYLLYAAIMGGKYVVLFEMDEDGVNHKQISSQAKKAKTIAGLTALAGLVSGNITTMGVGMNAQRTEMFTEFSRVKKVRSYPRRHMMKVNERFGHNQVYAAPEDFSFVESYIMARVPDSAKKGPI